MRSVERGVCPIASSTMNECIVHAQNDHISTSSLKSNVTVVFLDPDYLLDAEILAIRP